MKGPARSPELTSAGAPVCATLGNSLGAVKLATLCGVRPVSNGRLRRCRRNRSNRSNRTDRTNRTKRSKRSSAPNANGVAGSDGRAGRCPVPGGLRARQRIDSGENN